MLALGAFPVLAQDKITIVAFGDSLTQGYGLPEADGLVPKLQAWLDENSAVDVLLINAGVSGDTTAGGFSRIDWTLNDDVDAVIVALGGNDLLRGIFPEASRANMQGIMAAISTRSLPVMMVGLPAPSNYGPEFKEEYDRIYPELAVEYDAIHYPYFFAGLNAEVGSQEMLVLMQADGTHPSAKGVDLIVAHMGPVVLRLIAKVN